MLKTIKIGLIAFICLGTLTANAQKKITEGYITYTAEYNLPPDQQMAAAMLPKNYKVFFKDDLSRLTMDLGMMTNQVTTDLKNQEGLILINIPMADKKIAVKMTAEDKEKQKDMLPDYEITKTNESKVISGYAVTKYSAKDKKSNTTVDIWSTKDLVLPFNNLTEGFVGVQGFEGTPLEFVTNMNGITAKFSFKEVKQEEVKNLDMTIPSDYTIMTMEELMSMSGR
jgi:hypothetical protein